MKKLTMYRPGGSCDVWGVKCTFHSFYEDEVEQALSEGWHKSTLDFGSTGEPVDDGSSADQDGDGELSAAEAKSYAAEHGIDITGLHWKKVVKKVQDHIDVKNQA